jgi:hypothetical protein
MMVGQTYIFAFFPPFLVTWLHFQMAALRGLLSSTLACIMASSKIAPPALVGPSTDLSFRAWVRWLDTRCRSKTAYAMKMRIGLNAPVICFTGNGFDHRSSAFMKRLAGPG